MMSIQDLGSLGELIAALATLATLAYLALQIRQNTQLVRMTASQQVLVGIAEMTQQWSADPAMIDLFWRGLETPDELNVDEWRRFIMQVSSLVRRMELMFLNQRVGVLPDGLWESQVTGLKFWFSTPGMRRWMRDYGPTVHADFCAFVEAAVGPDPAA